MTFWRPTSERKRGTYVGGRDVAAIVGADRFATAGDVFAKMVSGHTVKMNKRMEMGLWYEAAMAEHVRVTFGVEGSRDVFYLDGDYGCSCDYVVGDVRRPLVLDSFKTTRSLNKGPEWEETWGREGTDEVAPAAAVQSQWEMMLSGAERSRIWLLDLDIDDVPRMFVVKRDNAKIELYRKRVDEFLNDCIRQNPPIPPWVAPYSDEAARAMWPKAVAGKKLEDVNDAFVQAAMRFQMARDMEKMAKEQKKAAGVILKHAMGTAEEARWSADPWSGRPKGSVFFKASTVTEPTTDYESVAHELAAIHKTDGRLFKGLIDKHTRNPFTDRYIRVHISLPKQKVTE